LAELEAKVVEIAFWLGVFTELIDDGAEVCKWATSLN
jgi:hypothetical protein